MSTPTTKWNPDALLGIKGNAKQANGIQCSGSNRSAKRLGTRCGWEKREEDPANIKARAMLPILASKPASQVTLQDLTELADLCLCWDRHREQKDTLAREWMKKVDQLAATESEVPVYPSTPENKRVTPSDGRPTVAFGLPTPPSSQSTSFNFEMPVVPTIPMQVPTFSFGADASKPRSVLGAPAFWTNDFEALRLEDKRLKAVEVQLTAQLEEQTTARGEAEQKLSGAETRITELTSDINQLQIDLAEAKLDRSIAEDELEGARQQIETLAAEKKSATESLAVQRKELIAKKDRELQAARFQYTAEAIRLKEKAAMGLEVQAQGYKTLVQQAERERDAIRGNYEELKQQTEAKLGSAAREHQRLQEEIAGLKRELDAATTENSRLAMDNAELVQQLREAQDALGAKTGRVSELEKELHAERTKPPPVVAVEKDTRSRGWLSRLWRRFRGRRAESAV